MRKDHDDARHVNLGFFPSFGKKGEVSIYVLFGHSPFFLGLSNKVTTTTDAIKILPMVWLHVTKNYLADLTYFVYHFVLVGVFVQWKRVVHCCMVGNVT